jgi:hypothetical protein
MHTRSMIEAHPDVHGAPSDQLVAAIDAGIACAETCTACADACLAEHMVAELRQCIRLNLDCADVCATVASILNRRTTPNEALSRQLLQVCITACWVCGEECERHAGRHRHCRICADACHRCERACQAALHAL